MTNISKRISIQGFSGSFHETAARSFYGDGIALLYCSTFSELIRKSEDKAQADGGLMAIENSIAGTILPNYQLLKSSNLFINGEIYLQIGQQLMALPGQTISDIKEIHSHHMAIKQCEDFLSRHAHIKIVEAEDTALSAAHISNKQLKGVAAIAGKQAASLFKLDIIAPNIETAKNNFTRFLALSKSKEVLKVANKASILFSTHHRPKALASILVAIGNYNFNISKIQSFPIIEKEWCYYFVLDIEFDTIENFKQLSDELAQSTASFRILGIYKKGTTV